MIAPRIAAAKTSNLRDNDNISSIALSAHGGANQRRSFFCDLGYLMSSKLNVSFETPLKEPNGKIMLAIPDIFVGDRLHPDSMHRQSLVKKFLTFLISEEYTCNWGLSSEFNVTRRILDSNRHDLKALVSTEGELDTPELSHSMALGKVLHCEQTMLFKIVTDREILSQLVDGLIRKIPNTKIADFFNNNPQITFDIVTYNDMCPKCFATCYNMQQRLQANINSLLIDKLENLHILSETITFPIPVTIVISSFRPFNLDDNSFTRTSDTLNLRQYATYSFAFPFHKNPIGNNG